MGGNPVPHINIYIGLSLDFSLLRGDPDRTWTPDVLPKLLTLSTEKKTNKKTPTVAQLRRNKGNFHERKNITK